MLLQGFRDLLNVLMGEPTQRIKIYKTTDDVYLTRGVNISTVSKTYSATPLTNYGSNVNKIPVLQKYSIIIGNGDTAVSFDDRCLSGGTSSVLSVGTYSQSNNKVIVSATFNPSVDYTVKEVGLIFWGSPSGYSDDYNILLSRTVLSEPVVMKAGDTKTFSVTIDMNKFFDTTTVS